MKKELEKYGLLTDEMCIRDSQDIYIQAHLFEEVPKPVTKSFPLHQNFLFQSKLLLG